MQYRHATATGHAALDAALVSAPGRPTLPVRLTVELFGRARERLGTRPVTVWDPCCGAGATLAVLGLRCPGVTALAGTDADPGPLDLARRNLGLLGPGGLDARADELDARAREHAKPSYAEAAAAVRALRPASRPAWSVSPADALDPAATAAALGEHTPDVVLADLPHGRQTGWAADGSGSDPGTGPEAAFLTGVAAVLAPDAVVVAVGPGRSVPLPDGVRPLERVRAGHRAAVLVRAGDLPRIMAA
ncbi:rRNA methyltransferase [Pseudonocardia phyllosphaerae]|uniref:rRNA methyltransferase n=1 Tax=Pseudonocardia phyllosphaerae TaxID=3390502 RepID=UPI00397B328E